MWNFIKFIIFDHVWLSAEPTTSLLPFDCHWFLVFIFLLSRRSSFSASILFIDSLKRKHRTNRTGRQFAYFSSVSTSTKKNIKIWILIGVKRNTKWCAVCTLTSAVADEKNKWEIFCLWIRFVCSFGAYGHVEKYFCFFFRSISSSARIQFIDLKYERTRAYFVCAIPASVHSRSERRRRKSARVWLEIGSSDKENQAKRNGNAKHLLLSPALHAVNNNEHIFESALWSRHYRFLFYFVLNFLSVFLFVSNLIELRPKYTEKPQRFITDFDTLQHFAFYDFFSIFFSSTRDFQMRFSFVKNWTKRDVTRLIRDDMEIFNRNERSIGGDKMQK